MENNNLSDKTEQENKITMSKKSIYIGISILIILLLGGIYIFVIKAKNTEKSVNSLSVLKIDSAIISKDSIKNTDEYEVEEESPYGEYRVISNSITLPNGKLNFGDRVFIDETKSNENEKIIYLENPSSNPNSQSYSISANSLIDEYRFEEYKNNFSLSPFSELNTGVKKILLGENYDDGNKYTVTQNAERAKSTIAFGDFDGDGITDVSVLMDNNEKQISRLLIICTNKVTKNPYIAYAENYSDKMKISSFKRNESVYINSEDFVNAPLDGTIVSGEDIKLAIIYTSDLQKFKSYTQE